MAFTRVLSLKHEREVGDTVFVRLCINSDLPGHARYFANRYISRREGQPLYNVLDYGLQEATFVPCTCNPPRRGFYHVTLTRELGDDWSI